MKDVILIFTLLIGLFISQTTSSVPINLTPEQVGLATTNANNGAADAQNNLGDMYFEGLGVKQSYTKAAKYYHLAADQGYALAQYFLGVMYDYGGNIKQSDTKAFKYYHLAAEQNDADAQYRLGLMYNSGRGVKQNYLIAKKWFSKACANGSQNGCENNTL